MCLTITTPAPIGAALLLSGCSAPAAPAAPAPTATATATGTVAEKLDAPDSTADYLAEFRKVIGAPDIDD